MGRGGLGAAALGAASGLRSMMGPAVLSRAASAGDLPGIGETPFSPLASSRAAKLFTIMEVGEVLVDKLPFVPSRTGAGPVFGRLVSGAVCGAALHAASGRRVGTGAVLGGLAAVAAAFVGERYRGLGASTGVPDPLLALLEDAAALGLASAAVRGEQGRPGRVE